MEREGNSTEIEHFDFSQWHLEAKTFKKMNDWSQKLRTMEESTSYKKSFNPWVINNSE